MSPCLEWSHLPCALGGCSVSGRPASVSETRTLRMLPLRSQQKLALALASRCERRINAQSRAFGCGSGYRKVSSRVDWTEAPKPWVLRPNSPKLCTQKATTGEIREECSPKPSEESGQVWKISAAPRQHLSGLNNFNGSVLIARCRHTFTVATLGPKAQRL